MPINKYKFAFYLTVTVVIVFGLSVSLQSLLAAWQPPSNNPPVDTDTDPLVYDEDGDSGNGVISIDQNLDVDQHMSLGASGAVNSNTILYTDETFTSDASSYGMRLYPTFNMGISANRYFYGAYILADAADVVENGFNADIYGTYSRVGIDPGSTINNAYGVYGFTYAEHTSGTVDTADGVHGYVRNNTTGNITTARGVRGVVINDEGLITNAYAGDFYTLANSTVPGVTISNARGVNSRVYEANSGEIANGYAFYANCDDASTCYGLRISAGDGQVGINNDWGVYSSGEDRNYFSGSLGVGVSPAYKLDVNAPSGQSVRFAASGDTTRMLFPEGGTIGSWGTKLMGIGTSDDDVSLSGSDLYVHSSDGRTEVGRTSQDYLPAATNWDYTFQLNGLNNTSIGFHDSGHSVSSIRYTSRLFTIGGDDGWGVAKVLFSGNVETAGWYGRTAHNNGGLVGSYNNVGANSTRSNPIYIIGSNYAPADTTLNNMYGVGYTHTNASFINGAPSGWGMYVAADGDARIFLNGSTGAVVANSFIYASDRSLKENIKPVENALDKVLNLEGVSFDWKESGESSLGLIAQDVEDVFPEIVHTSDDGLKSVEYGNLVSPLIEAIKEQQKQIEELKLEIEKLK